MKANRKYVEGEEAVSAVIGVILMVAITVAIAAVVYVYVSGIVGPGGEVTPTLQFNKVDQATTETLTVISADPENVEWGDLTIIVTTTEDGAKEYVPTATGAGEFGMSGSVDAGQVLNVYAVETGYGVSTTQDYTVAVRYDPTNTLTNEYTFNRG